MRDQVTKMLFRAKNAARLGGGVFAATVAGSASATPLDVTDVTDAITATLTPIGAIGIAVLGVLVGIKVFKWVRRAM